MPHPETPVCSQPATTGYDERDRGHRLASGRLETAQLEVFRVNAELRKRATTRTLTSTSAQPAAVAHAFVSSARYFFLRERLRLLRLAGTLPPERRASERPIAIACLRLFTFFPERPDFSVPRFLSCIAFLTLEDAFFPYRAMVLPPFFKRLFARKSLGEPENASEA
jgi:hypothetical protein